MLTSSDYDAISPVQPVQIRPISTERATSAPAASSPKYDSVTISSQTQGSRFRQELVSRISQQVRTATSTGDIQRLKQQVADGTYVPDPMRMAARILYLNEEDA
jgi:negative regulator of flagellin synthesis FlgM